MLTLGVIHILDLYDPDDKQYSREKTIAENIYNMDLDILVLQECSSLQLRYIQEKIGHLAYHSKVQLDCKNVSYDVISMYSRKVVNVRQIQNICGVQSAVLIMNIEIPPDKSTPRATEIELVNLYIPDYVDDVSRELVINTIASSVEKQAIICGDFLGWTNQINILKDWTRVFHFGHIATKYGKTYDPVAIYHTSALIVNNALLVDVANPHFTQKMSIRCCVAKKRPSSLLLEKRQLKSRTKPFESEPSVNTNNENILALKIKRRLSTCSDDVLLNSARIQLELESLIDKDNVKLDFIDVAEKDEVVEKKRKSWFKFKFLDKGISKTNVKKETSIVNIDLGKEETKGSYIKRLLLPPSLFENDEPLTPRGPKPIYLPVDSISPEQNVVVEKKKKKKHRKRKMEMKR